MKSTLLIFIVAASICFDQVSGVAQTPAIDDKLPSVQSPNVEGMAQFGKIPVSLFNGLPQISVPLGELNCGPIHLPISLRYNASGNKPDQHPSWAGLGWNLEAGGMITRHVNGQPDENSYFANRALLSASNWTDSAFIRSVNKDLQPDEYIISAPGLQATIFLNYDGRWLINSKENLTLKVSFKYDTAYSTPYVNTSHVTIPFAVSKFEITDNRGVVYVFGGQSNAIEFNFPALPGRYDFVDVSSWLAYFDMAPATDNAFASAWYLCSVTSPDGHKVKFEYDSVPAGVITQGTYDYFNNATTAYQPNPILWLNLTSKTYTPNFYLTRIVADDSLSCQFFKSLSNELTPLWKANPGSYNDFEIYSLGDTTCSKFYKLDSIVIGWGSNIVKKLRLEYVENNSERLKLKKVNYLDSKSQVVQYYSFDYNNKRLPDYNAHMNDHWGYYNGRYQFTSSNTAFSQAWANDYYAFRETDTAYQDAEMLTKMIYPTGGYTKFYYEPNMYSTVVQQWPSFSCSTLTVNKFSGGLRIKKIENSDGIKSTGLTEYFYSRDYLNGDTLSSGVLAGIPKYYESATVSGTFRAMLKSSFMGFLNTTNGNHITYTQVVERSAGSGFVVHTFSNQDNGYLDKPAFNSVVYRSYITGQYFQNKVFGKREIERGLLLKKQYYNSDKILLKEEVNQYNADTGRFDQYARAIGLFAQTDLGIFGNDIAFPIFSYQPYQRSSTVKEYNNGSPDPVITYSGTVYDSSYRLPVAAKYVNSAGDTIITTNSYSFNYGGTGQPVYDSMLSRNIILPLIEQKVFNGAKLLKTFRANYALWNNNKLIAPVTIKKAILGSSLDTELSLDAYDLNGNLTQSTARNEVQTAYLWNYKSLYQVAEVVNAPKSDVAYTSFETDSSNGWTVSLGSPAVAENTGGITGSREHQFDAGGTRPVTRSGINASKKYLISFWYKGAEPNITGTGLTQSNKFTTAGYNGWTYLQVQVTGATSISILNPTAQTGSIDELRMYPVGAQMITYAYKPGIGVSAVCDHNNRITYYEYDAFGRLAYIKDREGNILKKMEYKFLQ